MNFWQRLYNSVRTFYDQWYFDYLTRREQDGIIRKHFGPDMPGIRELERKLSLILINSHIALNGIQPRTPAAVDVGGLHVQDEEQTLQPVSWAALARPASRFPLPASRFPLPASLALSRDSWRELACTVIQVTLMTLFCKTIR